MVSAPCTCAGIAKICKITLSLLSDISSCYPLYFSTYSLTFLRLIIPVLVVSDTSESYGAFNDCSLHEMDAAGSSVM